MGDARPLRRQNSLEAILVSNAALPSLETGICKHVVNGTVWEFVAPRQCDPEMIERVMADELSRKS
ncbi:hypothetical protein E0H59_05390 [Rhizobium leguminosarum bv. viciae]|nr:hypothetical protein E0H59_05390 [Rhizobium leguminosarum bv. viciae]